MAKIITLTLNQFGTSTAFSLNAERIVSISPISTSAPIKTRITFFDAGITTNQIDVEEAALATSTAADCIAVNDLSTGDVIYINPAVIIKYQNLTGITGSLVTLAPLDATSYKIQLTLSQTMAQIDALIAAL